MIFMSSPTGGYMNVLNETDAKVAESQGWKRTECWGKNFKKAIEKTKVELVVAEKREADEAVPTSELRKQYFEKFGKQPHWNFNRHNMQKAINGDS